MAWYDNPGFGDYQDEEYSDAQPSRASFGVTASKNQGDGVWCPDCRKEGHYTWLSIIDKKSGCDWFSRCKIHGKTYSRPFSEA